jgi:hypothetical protein
MAGGRRKPLSLTGPGNPLKYPVGKEGFFAGIRLPMAKYIQQIWTSEV